MGSEKEESGGDRIMKFLDTLKRLSPLIGGLVGGPVGLIIGPGIKIAAELITGKTEPEEVLQALVDAPDKLRALETQAKNLEHEALKIEVEDRQDARGMAKEEIKETKDVPPWTKILTVIHRPIWSLLVLLLFAVTVLAPYVGWYGAGPDGKPMIIEIPPAQKEIMKTVIMFYFGGRSAEKIVKEAKGFFQRLRGAR